MSNYLAEEEKTLQTVSNESDDRLRKLGEMQNLLQVMQEELDSFIETV